MSLKVGNAMLAPCALLCLSACGDNRRVPDALSSDARDPGLPYFQMPMLPDYNHASETVVAAAGDRVVVLAIHQHFVSADTFQPPATDNDPDRPFRRLGYVSSSDGGATFSDVMPLELPGRTDPVLASAADGSFWASAVDPIKADNQTDLFHSPDGAVFTKVASVPIWDKAWITVDDSRQAVWIAGLSTYSLVGFDGGVRATVNGPGGIASAYSDTAGVHVMDINRYQGYAWSGLATDGPYGDGQELPAGSAPTEFTYPSLSMGTSISGTWIVRALRNSDTDASVVVRVRKLPDEGTDVTLTAPGDFAFMPASALDADGRLHVAWYDTHGPVGQLLYAHSETTDLLGAYTTPIIVDGNACPGDHFYPGPGIGLTGTRRLREYIGIATSGHRAFVTWTHAPEAPSRVRIAHVDF